jgi:carboxyl-terminal processing protease
MTSRIRLLVLAVSTPVIIFAVIGGYLGQAMARDETFRHLRIFEDVVSLVVNNYVEEVDVRTAMGGAMRGLADGLDADSAYLPASVVPLIEAPIDETAADVGLELRRQYYLRIVSARDGSPAAAAGLRTNDFIRAIDGRPTRDLSAYEGVRLLQGPAGSTVTLLVIRGNAADPHEVTLTRQRNTAPPLTDRMLSGGVGYVRVAEFAREVPERLKDTFETLAKSGATRYVIDLRGTARGDLDDGIAAARLFVSSGTLAVRQLKDERDTVAAGPGDGRITAPVVLLVSQGTAGAAELFAAALAGNGRADLVGERTIGRAARQRLVKLPDGSGLLMSHVRYLTPDTNSPIHERGLEPTVRIEQPDVEFGLEPPPGDPTLDRAIDILAQKRAA